MRCDLHVHTLGSGMCTTPGLSRVCKESYNEPAAVYERCKRLGMSIVTVTDHDSLEGSEALRKYPDFFLSEEATVRMPSGTEIHMGIYGITERDHAEIQRRRRDFIALLMYLTERKLFFSVNHVLSSLTGRREEEDFQWFASYVPAFEVRNGQMWESANQGAARLAERFGKAGVAGSDSHTLAGVGMTYTEVPGSRTVEEFLLGLRAGQGVVRGEHGSFGKLTVAVFQYVGEVLREKPWALPLIPMAALIPAFTGYHWVSEKRFCRKWAAQLDGKAKRPRMLWEMDPRMGVNWAG